MCGIAGFVQRQSSGEFESVLRRMTDRMRLRGPDGEGRWISEAAQDGGWKAALGHRRLSIIDLEGGAQPLGNETARIQITFNGEIFNFLQLRPELEKRGHRFKTRSDTEVIVHHFEEFGEEGIKDLNGMFAFALWDDQRSKLVLARDRAGVKPLYYARLGDGGLVFASELTALLQHPGVAKGAPRISESALAGYFFSDYVHAPESMIDGVFKLEPGHWMAWEKGKLSEPRAFWNLADVLSEPARDSLSVSAAANELRELLESSVERQLISDVRVGIFLSGGIDSSVVAALARKKAGGAIRTFSIAFEDKDFDESGYARMVAKHLGTDHREQTLSEAALLESFDSALGSLDEPNSDPSILPTYCLAHLTVRSVKVALGGDGGDELFAGYPTYKAHRYSKYYGMIPAGFRKLVVDEMVSRLPVNLGYQSFEWKAKRFALRWERDPARRHLRWMSNTDLPELGAIVSGAVEPWALRWLAKQGFGGRQDALNELLALDFMTYLPGSVLSKVDRASMGNSLEVRPPFMDNEVMDWAFRLPSSLKLNGGTSKYVLKEMARGLLPSEVIDRPKKGFAIPLGRWLRGPLKNRVDSVLKDSPLWQASQGSTPLSRSTFESWAREHVEGRTDRSKPLWALVVLDHWARREGVHVG